ncbi:hypothetical protein PQR70_34660 [Paraburkholderia madseniana]|uniref:Uncharacterized protein n=1 Tax=Paraburkholderia madseniana TaxID=2599607 RepID=A0AAP5BHK2_9BURK|nr:MULTISPECIES: hypothetical protein [Paraburkholderia]MCX4149675.1 hypothetical protein [Paraburkholderia madseniana]MDN7152611.1 hypothetical protein [Paraburkholderia sp. WS6]MDQ6411493.1 hypothetical protein [Paraburkholderia madseniana]
MVNEAIREVVALIRAEATKHGISVETRLDDALPFVHGDRVKFQQVMLNLMMGKNSLAHTARRPY